MKASVIIPTKNPGPSFADILAAVIGQNTEWPFEILVVDSGSSDGTLDLIRNHPEITLIEILPTEFGHGRTRNLAIGKARGEFCALLTQDAKPASNRWLAELVAAVAQDDLIAGALGPHVAYSGHSAFTRRDLERHFGTFAQMPLVVSRETDPARYVGDPGWRQVLHFYSDNNSCLRRSVWEKIPYPDVDFAEDQIWAMRIIEAGWKKAFAPGAAVFHSHDYGPLEHLQRAFDESLAFRRLFGYRLGTTPWRAVLSAVWMSTADWRWGWSNNVRLNKILAQIARDFAVATGHWLGSCGDRLPNRLRTLLSRDKKLFYAIRPIHSIDRD
jgi:rhamnosyltransferase